MGLDAYVKCNCFKNGLAAKLPFAEELLTCDADGYFDVKRLPEVSDVEYHELERRLHEWERNACPHYKMYYCSEWVGNWWGVRAFQQAMGQIGAEHFPVLYNALPDGNYGRLEAEQAAAALAELALFEDRITAYENVFLQDAGSHETIYDYIAVCNGKFAWNYARKSVSGFDAQGFFIRNRKTGRELFRSMHFAQKVKPVFWRKKPQIILTDLVSGRRVTIHSAIGGEARFRIFKVNRRQLTLSDYYVTGQLKKLLNAALETGNAVIWT